jgi:N-acetylglucosamine-6-phosphate deacetylase
MSEPYALIGEVLTTEAPTRAAVVIRDGKIDALLREPRAGDLPRNHSEFAGLLCPGFIDLQINGAFGADIGTDPEAIGTLAAHLPATGVTSFLPTLISSPPSATRDSSQPSREARQKKALAFWGHTSRGLFSPRNARGRTTQPTCGLWTWVSCASFFVRGR